MFLGHYPHVGAEIAAAFMSAVSATAGQMVRSVILARPGLEARARPGAPLQELVKGIPADLFRTCLARVTLPTFLTRLTGLAPAAQALLLCARVS